MWMWLPLSLRRCGITLPTIHFGFVEIGVPCICRNLCNRFMHCMTKLYRYQNVIQWSYEQSVILMKITWLCNVIWYWCSWPSLLSHVYWHFRREFDVVLAKPINIDDIIQIIHVVWWKLQYRYITIIYCSWEYFLFSKTQDSNILYFTHHLRIPVSCSSI
jgi:hypothetical protein